MHIPVFWGTPRRHCLHFGLAFQSKLWSACCRAAVTGSCAHLSDSSTDALQLLKECLTLAQGSTFYTHFLSQLL